MSPAPPRFLLRLLERALPPGVSGQSMVGDLVEEWHRRDPGLRRTLWFTAAAGGLAGSYAAASAARVATDAVGATGETLRRVLREPVQTTLTVLALGVGIAAPATMFSVAEGLTRDPGLGEPDRIVHMGRRFTPRIVGIAPLGWLWPGVGEVDAFESVGIYAQGSADLAGAGGPPRRVRTVQVTPGALEALGATAALGRAFGPDEAGGNGAPVLLSWELWQSRFGADPDLPGATVRLDGAPRTVVGVMPEGFDHPGGAAVWTPLDPDDPAQAGVVAYLAVGRLADGATLEEARAQVAALEATLRDRGEEIAPGRGLAAQLWEHKLMAPQDRRMLSLLVVLVGFVLAIACADVLNLLLARAASRSRQTAVRLALGAGRGRIVGRHLAEAGTLAALAGVVGLGLTALGVHVFEVRTAGQLAHWMEVEMDLPVLLFGVGMVALAALGTGLVPALQSSRIEVGPALRSGARGASTFRIGRLGRLLVVGEIALSCALLAIAGVMVHGAVSGLAAPGDLDTGSVLTARYELRAEAYDAAAADAFHRKLVESLEAKPGVAGVAVMSGSPGLPPARRPVEVEGGEPTPPGELPRAGVVATSPSFLSALGAEPVRGRAPPGDESEGVRWALVDEVFARRHLADRDPLGARIRLPTPRDTASPAEWRTVVGVVPRLGLDPPGDDAARIYLPLSGEPVRRASLLVRVRPGVDPLSRVSALREEVERLDPDLALWEVGTLAARIEEARAVESTFAGLFLTFGVAGLLLAGVGLFGLLAFTVRIRTRELGVRIALGAPPLRVLRTAVGGGLVQLLLGLGAGLGLAALVAPRLGPALMGADPQEPLVYGTVAAVLGLTGALAAYLPARRALAVDVVEAIRTE